ncbi:hypothetical protein Patl1_23506 [Pistacia atlantica]|uniref:Uncharacterized protein n=1 Tax=Pistacia atlantica TaxID=434234 RepID=A0ACC0ZX44_9ROSI|nr:hypothetical protein Patl1_23506 [Pistacia atlantica]
MHVVSDAVLSSPTPAGAAIGSGRQTMVAYINICSYYFIGVPVGVLLGYVANLKIKVNKASERLNRFKRPLEESNGDYNIVNE